MASNLLFAVFLLSSVLSTDALQLSPALASLESQTTTFNTSIAAVYLPPIELIYPKNSTETFLGSDEFNCSTKDATGARAKAATPFGYMSVVFNSTDSTPRNYLLRAMTYAPDSLANSFTMTMTGVAGLLTWNTLIAKIPTMQSVVADGGYACYALRPGPTEVRLYVREPGAAVSRLLFTPIGPLRIGSVTGCDSDCTPGRSYDLYITLLNFCGASAFRRDLVLFNGAPCPTLTLISDDYVRCTTPVLPSGSSFALRLNSSALFNATDFTIPIQKKQAAAVIGAVVGSVAGAMLIIIVVVACFGGRRKGTGNAPKDESKPFAIMFTDIESSTALWARNPSAMSTAIETHHDIIRKQLQKHRGYEVKTIGDAFMSAFKNPSDAVACAMEVQVALHESEWPAAINEFYANAHSNAKSDRTSWNGLRVRIGVHYGIGCITFDEVAQSYDYYGTVVNAAARVEALGHGGQTLVTEEVVSALDASSTEWRTELNVVSHPLGGTSLRGLEHCESVVLYEFLPLSLSMRTFEALRHEIFSDDVAEIISLANSQNSNTDNIDAYAAALGQRYARGNRRLSAGQATEGIKQNYEMLKAMLAVGDEKFKLDLLSRLCGKWSVPMKEARWSDQASAKASAKASTKGSAAYEAMDSTLLNLAARVYGSSAERCPNTRRSMVALPTDGDEDVSTSLTTDS